MVDRPDIVLLVLDTQRRDRLSCYGYERATTPNVDRLAADAARFTSAFSAAQWTIPSHSSMFTGLYPSRHTMLHASSVLPESIETLAQRLSAGGYFTAAYCNNPLLGVLNNGLQRGFQSFLNYSGWMTSRPNQLTGHPTWFDRYRKRFKRLLARILNVAQDAFARSDALLEFSFSPLMVPFWQTALSFKGNSRKALNDAARLMIERKGLRDDQPVFTFINLMGVHMPFHPPRRYLERFAPIVLREKWTRRYLRHFNSDIFGWLAPLNSPMNERERAVLSDVYDAEVAYQDELVGAFIEQLRASGRLDRTLFMVCADHGEHLGERRLMGHCVALYNELVHVPLIIRDPDGYLPRGSVMEQNVSLRRVFHTALTAAHLASEQEERLTLAQSAETDPERGRVFSEGLMPMNVLSLLQKRRRALVEEYRLDLPRYGIWEGKYKLVQSGDDEDRLELYSMAHDPYEHANLCEQLPDVARTMQHDLRAFLHGNEPAAPAIVDDEFDEDPEVYRRLRDLGYVE